MLCTVQTENSDARDNPGIVVLRFAKIIPSTLAAFTTLTGCADWGRSWSQMTFPLFLKHLPYLWPTERSLDNHHTPITIDGEFWWGKYTSPTKTEAHKAFSHGTRFPMSLPLRVISMNSIWLCATRYRVQKILFNRRLTKIWSVLNIPLLSSLARICFRTILSYVLSID